MKDRGQEPHFAGGLRRPATISPSSREWLALSGLVDRRLSVSRSNTAKPRYNEPRFSEIPAIARWPRYLN